MFFREQKPPKFLCVSKIIFFFVLFLSHLLILKFFYIPPFWILFPPIYFKGGNKKREKREGKKSLKKTVGVFFFGFGIWGYRRKNLLKKREGGGVSTLQQKQIFTINF